MKYQLQGNRFYWAILKVFARGLETQVFADKFRLIQGKKNLGLAGTVLIIAPVYSEIAINVQRV